jgi:hypothetical protein
MITGQFSLTFPLLVLHRLGQYALHAGGQRFEPSTAHHNLSLILTYY